MAKGDFRTEGARRFIVRMLKLLRKRPMIASELEPELFASRSKVNSYLRYLHGRDVKNKCVKRVYVFGYEQDCGGRVPRYAAGNKPDADPPGKRTEAERWARLKADPARHIHHKAQVRARQRELGVAGRRRAEQGVNKEALFAPLGL